MMRALARAQLGRIATLRPAWIYGGVLFGLLYAALTLHLDERLFYTLKTAWHEHSWVSHVRPSLVLYKNIAYGTPVQ